MTHIVAIDTETTGLSCGYHEIIEFGAVRTTAALCEVARLSMKILPEHIGRAAPEALRTNGYSPEEWEEAVPGSLAAQWIQQFCWGCVPLAHNAPFDLKFLNALLAAHQKQRPWVEYSIDTMARGAQVKAILDLPNRKLETVAEALGLEQKLPHRALDDALLALNIERLCRQASTLEGLKNRRNET